VDTENERTGELAVWFGRQPGQHSEQVDDVVPANGLHPKADGREVSGREYGADVELK